VRWRYWAIVILVSTALVGLLDAWNPAAAENQYPNKWLEPCPTGCHVDSAPVFGE
jgi:hypothetical protein